MNRLLLPAPATKQEPPTEGTAPDLVSCPSVMWSANGRRRCYNQGTRKQKPRLFFETEKQRFLFVFVEAAEGKQEGLWEGSGHSGQGAVGGHAGTRHE